MTDHTDDRDEGRGSLAPHLLPAPVPASLRDRVRGSMFARGLLADGPRVRRSSLALWAVAAACFVAGILASQGTSLLERRTTPTEPTARYALLLYGGQSADTSPDPRGRAREYGRWAASLSGDAKFVSGHELGRVVGDLSGASQAAAAGFLEPVAGFFIIDAPSDAVAKRIAGDCPHLRYGGRVVVMEIES